MMRIVVWTGMCIGVLGITIARADDAQSMLEKVRAKYESIKDAEVKFSQRTVFEMTQTEHRSSGTLFIKKENKYRVELTNATIVTDGNTVWSYNPASNQVLIDKFKLEPGVITPERVLTAAPKNYFASVLGKEKVGKTETVILKLTPKDSDSMIRTMKIWVDESTWLFRQVEIDDQNGRLTTYTISEFKINPGIPDSRFTYQIPNGVEAVDLR